MGDRNCVAPGCNNIDKNDGVRVFRFPANEERNVSKYYKRFLAVHNISVSVEKGECFGLLGVNGAGKTTTFKMLTGETSISKGDAYIQDYSIRSDINTIRKKVGYGYCPQFNALIEEFTVREVLHLFCLIRGVPKRYIEPITLYLAEKLLFTPHIGKRVKNLSGGNKRKVSTAVALVGEPPLLFLDEPTSGMDPVARRYLWNALCRVRDAGTSIVLTSHSMEECEVLCSRLAIMVNGNFKCLGSTQYLKNLYAEGYTLMVKVSSDHVSPRRSIRTSRWTRSLIGPDAAAVDAVKAFLEKTFPDSTLDSEFMGMLTYQIPSSQIKWSNIFGIMERAKRDIGIEDYSLGQTSLEQVFLMFARAQQEES